MTKKQAESHFRSQYLPAIRDREENGIDYARRREEWHVFTDYLMKSRLISERQYDTWVSPGFCNPSPPRSSTEQSTAQSALVLGE